METKEAILQSLRSVIDPEIGVNIVDLGMVRDVVTLGDTLLVKVALTVKGCPLAHTLEGDITQTLSGKGAFKKIVVQMDSMSPEELSALGTRLQQMKAKDGPGGKPGDLGSGTELLDKKRIASIIAVASGKGGVGKSFTTAALAVELRRMGYEVGILDADITGPSMGKMFGMTGSLEADERGVIPKVTGTGIKLISTSFLLDEPDTPTIWRGPIINGAIRQLYGDANWGDLHFLLVDLPPGTSDAPLTVFQSLPVDGVVIVTTPQDLAMLVVRKAITMARQLNVPIIGVLENMSYIKCTHCDENIEMYEESGVEQAAKELQLSFLGKLPFDPKINRLADQGRIEEFRSPETEQVTKNLRVELAKQGGVTVAPIAWKVLASEQVKSPQQHT